ncbi:MAG TPA: ABC transporter transmembrane domain-containing protein [Actinomycetota bacterium]|nr:ABC transporter transmembrane domain-containing protein [Actinomycetota bacterium]
MAVIEKDGVHTTAAELERAARSEHERGRRSGEPSSAGEVRRAFRLLRRYSRGQGRSFGFAVAVLVVEAATAVLEAYPLAYLIDYFRGDRPALEVPGLPTGRASTVLILTLGVLVLAAVNSAADSGAEIFLARGGQTLAYKLRVALFAHLQKLSLAYHDRRRTGDVITRVTGDVKELEEFVTDSVSDLIGSVFLIVGVLAFLVSRSWQVTVVGVVMIPLLVYVSNYYAVRIKKAAKRQRAREGDLASTTQEMLTSIRVVQTFGRTRRAEERFSGESGQAMDAAYETSRLEAWFSWVWSVLKAIAIGAVVWIGLFVVRLDLGILVMCVLLIEEMFKPTRKIIKEWNRIGKLLASVERIAEVLDREPTVRDEPGAAPAPRLRGSIEFRDVCFAYPLDAEDRGAADGELRPALRDVSFSIPPGRVVALVGHSGAGKTSIAQLVPRLYDPQEGAVLLDGHDVRTFTLESLRAEISVVLQETVLFRGTVAENIAYGKEEATRAQIVEAAKLAHAHEFIERMPDGYDTEVSERATNLSGGQRQRIAIARAIIRDTPILILDEPTTGLDVESSEIVLAALRTLMQGKTTLLISHDLELVRSADHILVLRSGRIEQQGSHDELLAQGGLYAQLYARQFRDPPGDAEEADVPEPASLRRLLSEVHEMSASMRARARAEGPSEPPAREGRIDPLAADGLAREVPGLEIALDRDEMSARLADALVRGRGEVARCSPGKAVLVPGEGLHVRYRAEVVDADGARSEVLVGGRLLRTRPEMSSLLARLEPLGERARGRKEVARLEAAVASLADIPMALHAFPIDAELPTLIEATDAGFMLRVFRDALTRGSDRRRLGSVRVELAHYPRRHHCLLRYELEASSDGAPARRTLFGKVTGNGDGRAAAGLTAVRAHLGAGDGAPPGFRLPRYVGVLPELHLSLVEGIPGTPAIGGLVAERAAGGAAEPLEGYLRTCGAIAAAVHGAPPGPGGGRTLEGDLDRLGTLLANVRRHDDRLARRLEASADEVRRAAASVPPLDPVLVHGDFTHTQVLFDASGSGLLDFDTVAGAEPALDLGHFWAYLRVACRRAGAPQLGDPLCEEVAGGYAGSPACAVDERILRRRAALFEAASLLGIALRSWHQLKAARTTYAVEALEERVGCLQAPAR